MDGEGGSRTVQEGDKVMMFDTTASMNPTHYSPYDNNLSIIYVQLTLTNR